MPGGLIKLVYDENALSHGIVTENNEKEVKNKKSKNFDERPYRRGVLLRKTMIPTNMEHWSRLPLSCRQSESHWCRYCFFCVRRIRDSKCFSVGRTFPKLPLPLRISIRLIHGSLGPYGSAPKRYLDRFCRAHERGKQTYTPTDHTTPSVAIGRIKLLLWCALKIKKLLQIETTLNFDNKSMSFICDVLFVNNNNHCLRCVVFG